MKSDKEVWLKEYSEFIKSDNVDVPNELVANVKARLFPSPWVVFSKILAIHSTVGFLSLAGCNQFGLNPFGTNYSLMDWFMHIGGHHFCMFACGVFFMTSTHLFANLLLNLEELETIKRYEWLQTAVLGLLSIAAFYFFGAELVATFVGLWIIGAFVGSLVTIESSYLLRRQTN